MQKKENNFKKGFVSYQGRFFDKGFTLLEILVAIFIFAVGIVGVAAFFNASIKNQNQTKNELIAVGLAQEGPEIVRNIVEYNSLNNKSWWENVADSATATQENNRTSCKRVDYQSFLSHECADTNKENLCFSGGRYLQCVTPMNEKNPAIFNREIFIRIVKSNGSDCKINPPSANCDLNKGDCLEVISRVSWEGDRTTSAKNIICKPTY